MAFRPAALLVSRSASLRSPLAAVNVALLGTVACTATTSAGIDEADASSSVSALVVVERAVGDDGAARTTAIARYFRGTLDERIVRTLGADLQLPAIGACADLGEGSGPAALARGLELEEAGAVTLEASDRSLTLTPRWVPDPLGRVRGTIYSGAWAERANEATNAPITLRSAHFGDATFVAPREPAGLAVAGTLVTGAATAGGVLVAPSGNVELAWNAPEVARDVIYADVASEAGSRSRCAFADTGRARITLPAGNGTLTVHRLYRDARRAGAGAAGFAADVRYDAQVAVSFSAR